MDNKNHIYSNHQPKNKDLRRKCNATVYKSIWKLFFGEIVVSKCLI